MSLAVHPIEPIGAEITGIDLGEGLSDGVFEELHAALLTHGLLLLRSQTLDDDQQIALGRRFGALEGQEFTAGSAQRDPASPGHAPRPCRGRRSGHRGGTGLSARRDSSITIRSGVSTILTLVSLCNSRRRTRRRRL